MPVHHFVRAICNYHSLLHYISLSQGTSKRTLLLLSPALLHVAMLWHRRPEIAVVSHCSLGHCVRQDFAQGWGWMTTYFNARIDAYHDNALRRLRKVLATSQWTQRFWPTAAAWCPVLSRRWTEGSKATEAAALHLSLTFSSSICSWEAAYVWYDFSVAPIWIICTQLLALSPWQHSNFCRHACLPCRSQCFC